MADEPINNGLLCFVNSAKSDYGNALFDMAYSVYSHDEIKKAK